jgi:hypothetical protein
MLYYSPQNSIWGEFFITALSPFQIHARPHSINANRSGTGISANRALIEWVCANGMEFNYWDTEQGDNIRSRYEIPSDRPQGGTLQESLEIEVAIN